MEEFSFWQEVAKQAIASAFAAAVLVVGAWVTFVRSLRENRRKQVEELEKELEKQRAERREKFVTETLVTAYRDLEAMFLRDSPLFLGHKDIVAYRLRAEEAIRDIQLLGDAESARIAQSMAMNTSLFQNTDVVQSLFVTMRHSLRERLGLGEIAVEPALMRFMDDDAILKLDDTTLAGIGADLSTLKKELQANRAFVAGTPDNGAVPEPVLAPGGQPGDDATAAMGTDGPGGFVRQSG